MSRFVSKQRRTGIVIGVAFFVFVTASEVRSDTERGLPQYTTESADKRYVFVMLKGGDPDNPEIVKSEKYPESGLYRNDGSHIPLWTVDWAGMVIVLSDGVHVIKRGGWPRQSDGGSVEALSFLENGKLVKTYRVSDLVALPWLLPHTSSHYMWQRVIPEAEGAATSTIFPLYGGAYEQNEGAVLDEEAQTLRVATLQGDTYVFDIRTGVILSSRRPVRLVLSFGLPLLALLYLGYVLLSARRAASVSRIRWLSIIKILGIWAVLILLTLLALDNTRLRPAGMSTALTACWRATVYWPVYVAERFGWQILDDSYWAWWSFLVWSLVLVLVYFLNRLIIDGVASFLRRSNGHRSEGV